MSKSFHFTDSHARHVARAIGLLGAQAPPTAAILITPGRDDFELCVRSDDEPLAHLPSLCRRHRGPIVLISSRAGGSSAAVNDIGLFDAGIDIALEHGGVLVDWLVVDGDQVSSLGWDGLPGWVVSAPRSSSAG